MVKGADSVRWQSVAIAVLCTALLTSCAGWFSFARGAVQRDELKDLQSTVVALTATVVDLKTTVAVLSDRVERSTLRPITPP